ncbi:MAG: hypothetical protein AB8F95_04725, partial [Bacteroidia bacterium]
DATPSDGASMSLWPNSDPGGSGDIALQTGTNGETRFERYDAPTSSYVRNVTIKNDGKVSIGTNTNTSAVGYRLFVTGGIMTGQVKVDQAWADYVFDEDYTLPALDSVETFIEQNGHLPNIPSQTELDNNGGGFEIGDMTRLQQEKIEELFLYIIQMENRIKELETKLDEAEEPLPTND